LPPKWAGGFETLPYGYIEIIGDRGLGLATEVGNGSRVRGNDNLILADEYRFFNEMEIIGHELN